MTKLQSACSLSCCSFHSCFPFSINFCSCAILIRHEKGKLNSKKYVARGSRILYLDVRTCPGDAVPHVVGDVPVAPGDSEHVLNMRYPVDYRVILLLEVLKTMNGLISLKLSINVTISCAGRAR